MQALFNEAKGHFSFVFQGTICSIRAESALPEGLRVEAQLQRSRCHQMGALHRSQRHLWDPLLRAVLLWGGGRDADNKWVGMKRIELFIMSRSSLPSSTFYKGLCSTPKHINKGKPKRTSKTSWIKTNVPFRINIVYLQWWKFVLLMNIQNFTCYEMICKPPLGSPSTTCIPDPQSPLNPS